VRASLGQIGAPGQDWRAELETSRNSWNDDLALPFAAIPGYAAKIRAGETI
jgi:pyruvate,water dikinase